MNELIRLGIFYDGSYFLHVSNYYNYHHPRKARINIRGLHALTAKLAAAEEGVDEKLCRVVDAHYFRARMNAAQADEHNKLYAERAFDDILASEGVVTHYLPHKSAGNGQKGEEGISIWLALEAFDRAVHQKYDVIALIASENDYIPLTKKLNSLGVRVMVLGWDFEATASDGRKLVTQTSRDLLAEASYPLLMHSIIEDRIAEGDPFTEQLFVPRKTAPQPADQPGEPEEGEMPRVQGPLMTIKSGYGFIERAPNNVFFHYSDLVNADFADLREGDILEFSLFEGGGRDGGDVARKIRLIDTGNENEDLRVEGEETEYALNP